ncbi:hypothetical protein HMPREF1091_01410 [Atopobium minutum 10063974]|uniref:Uncharacterized protein n=1 Tax=Atopobium minutum 10063974 TaxID=997872 RepID=N2BFE7_9ACTN|nr:hypothetical protein HMPREF1091_01410 [Atopobium minutum 10063974]
MEDFVFLMVIKAINPGVFEVERAYDCEGRLGVAVRRIGELSTSVFGKPSIHLLFGFCAAKVGGEGAAVEEF